MSRRIYILSPASAGGERARLLRSEGAGFELARRMRSTEGAPLGEVFTFLSGLYFRGKLAYAQAFAAPPARLPGVVVITPCEGLQSPDRLLSLDDLRRFAAVPIDAAEERYRVPLLRDARGLASAGGRKLEVVLLGSVATAKYVEPLMEVFGERLLFPAEFVGRGDMSRGGLMLRCVEAGQQLTYVPVRGAVRHGARPPKLTPRRWRSSGG